MRAKRHAHFPAARELADVAVHHLRLKAQARENLARPAFERVAAELFEARLHFAVALDDVVHLVRSVWIGHGGFEACEFGGNLADGARTVHRFGDRAAARHFADVLAEIADRDAAIGRDLAFVRLLLARDRAEQRRLAGAVRPDEADLLAPVQHGGGFDEHDLVAVLLADVVETDHGLPRS